MNEPNTGSWSLWWPESVAPSWRLWDYGTDAIIHPIGTDFSCKTGPSPPQLLRTPAAFVEGLSLFLTTS